MQLILMKTSDLLIGVVFLGGIAHLMIFQNGYWSDVLWLSVVLNVGIPIVIYKYLKISAQKKQSKRLSRKYMEI